VTGTPDPRAARAGSVAAAAPPLALLVTTTVPTQADASRIAEAVVAERLAACAQVQGPIQSTFRWQGRVDQATEWYVHCKTATFREAELLARLKALHPYDVPEIVATPIVAGHPPYLRWIDESVSSTQ
jgi:periplasmic divalent cation tolerance protein